MNEALALFQNLVSNSGQLKITSINAENESQEYLACTFHFLNRFIHFRKAKITPKKIGQFVTFWKRDEEGITVPYSNSDSFDYLIIQVSKGKNLGHFIFPKSILKSNGIVSSNEKEGKRGFRIYAPWDEPTSKQGHATQNWQILYFVYSNDKIDLEKF